MDVPYPRCTPWREILFFPLIIVVFKWIRKNNHKQELQSWSRLFTSGRLMLPGDLWVALRFFISGDLCSKFGFDVTKVTFGVKSRRLYCVVRTNFNSCKFQCFHVRDLSPQKPPKPFNWCRGSMPKQTISNWSLAEHKPGNIVIKWRPKNYSISGARK